MYDELKVHGIVLSSGPVGDYDRRVTMLTIEMGRISAFAQGARRQGSPLSACSQSFVYGEFTLRVGRDSYRISSIEKANYFEPLRKNADAMYYGLYFCELIGYLTREGNDEGEQVRLLYAALLMLGKDVVPYRLIRYVFELKTIALYGEAPLAEGCFYSGSRDGLISERTSAGFEVCESTLYTVQYILSTPASGLFSFTVNDRVLDELGRISSDFLGRHVDRPMKSREILEMMTEQD